MNEKWCVQLSNNLLISGSVWSVHHLSIDEAPDLGTAAFLLIIKKDNDWICLLINGCAGQRQDLPLVDEAQQPCCRFDVQKFCFSSSPPVIKCETF